MVIFVFIFVTMEMQPLYYQNVTVWPKLDNRIIPMEYIGIARGSPCVVPSCDSNSVPGEKQDQ